MIANDRIEVVIGGVRLAVPVGGVVPIEIVESWRASNSLDRAIAQGVISDDKPKSQSRQSVRPYKAQVQIDEKDKDADE